MSRLLLAFVLGASCVTLGLYAVHAGTLVAYPWDWDPDEGLFLDYACRAWEAPGTLYGRTVVPYPACHGPLQPFILAPLVASSAQPLRPIRVFAVVWTATIAACVYVLVRRKSEWPLALASAALALGAFDLTFWFMLVRPDGLMTALWLLAAVTLLPSRLARGADRLGWPRVAAGAALLLASVLVKLSAVAHGIPLVLGWWLVDRRSAVRLTAAMGAAGIGALLLLQALTAGGFLWAMQLWSLNPRSLDNLMLQFSFFFERSGPMWLLTAAAFLGAARTGARALRDGAILLCLGGLGILPALSKWGAWWSYLLPLLCAMVILAGRLWANVPPRPGGMSTQRLAAALTAALALWLGTTRRFPVPSGEHEKTASAFYAFVAEATRADGKRLLALRPEYAYYVARQPVEIEGASIDQLVAAGLPGIDVLRDRLQRSTYGLVVSMAPLPGRDLDEILQRNYVKAGRCDLEFFLGSVGFALFVPRDGGRVFAPPPGTRCHAYARP